MPGLEVCTAIDSILAAFSNCMDVCKRLSLRKQKRSSKSKQVNDEDFRLHKSLSQRPQEIQTEYHRSLAKYGHPFRAGDPQAHSSLAHTLLVLNTGLIEIINLALHNTSKDKTLARKSLLNLSEVAAADTLDALTQLKDRISLPSRLPLTMQHPPHHEPIEAKPVATAPKERPAPSPLLERGGWVRSSSGSTVVSAASAQRRAARKVEHKRSQSSPAVQTHKVIPSAKLGQFKDVKQTVKQSSEGFHAYHGAVNKKSSKDWMDKKSFDSITEHERRPPSMLIVPADYFETYPLTSQPPARPPKIPLYSRPNPNVRARPISSATFMTTSTKIGEIPENRWPDRFLSTEQQQQVPLPYVIPPPLLEEPKKKRRGFRLWKRQPVAAC